LGDQQALAHAVEEALRELLGAGGQGAVDWAAEFPHYSEEPSAHNGAYPRLQEGEEASREPVEGIAVHRGFACRHRCCLTTNGRHIKNLINDEHPDDTGQFAHHATIVCSYTQDRHLPSQQNA
jgi:hypothetical protein